MTAEFSPLHSWLKPISDRRVPRTSRLRCEALEDRVTPSIGFGFSGDVSLGLAPEATAISLSASTVETAIAINPTAPGNLVATTNNFGATNLEVTARSTTAGASWSTVTIGNSVDTLPNTGDRFDGTVATDRFGNIHIVYEHRNGSIVYAYSSNGGQSYTGRVLSVDPSCDKPWLAVGPDAANPAHDAVWVTYSRKKGLPMVIGGGTYTFDGSTYREFYEFGSRGLPKKLVGKEQVFTADLDGEVWTHSGTVTNGFRVCERWQRVS